MKRSQEETARVLADPGKELIDLCPAAKDVVFNADPETAKTEKLLLVYYLNTPGVRNKKPEAKAELLRKRVESLMNRTDDLSRYAMSLTGEARGRMQEDLAATVREKVRINDLFNDISNNRSVMKDPLYIGQSYIEGMFSPEVTAEKQSRMLHDFSDVTDEFLSAINRVEKAVLDRKPMQVPDGLTEREVTMMTMGCFLSDENMRFVSDKIMSLGAAGAKGSSLVRVGTDEQNTRDLIFSNLLTKDARMNMHAARLSTDQARASAETVLEAYTAGNPQPFVDSLKQTFTAALAYTRSVPNMRQIDGRSALALAVETADMLQSPKFAQLAKMTPEEERFADNCRVQFKAVREIFSLESEMLNHALKHFYEKPAADPKFVQTVNRWGELNTILNHTGKNTDIYSFNSPKDLSPEALDDYKAHRAIDEYEQAVAGKNEAMREFLADKFKGSDICKAMLNAKTGRDLFDEIRAFNPSALVVKSTLRPDIKLNIAYKNDVDKIKADDPAVDSELKKLMSTAVSGRDAPMIDKDPTPEQLLERKQVLRNIVDKLKTDYPKPVPGVKETGEDGNVISAFRNAATDGISVIDSYLKQTYPEKQTVAALDSLMKLQKNARETGESVLTADAKGKPVSNLDAAKLLAAGKPVQMEKFLDGRFVGVTQPVTLGNNGQLVMGKAQPAYRSVNYQVEDGTVADQMKSLHFVKEMLDKTQSFFVKNSKEFNSLMKSLNEVIKAQENIGENANIRQVKSLNEMYDKLHKDAKAYVDYKKASVKDSDVRGRTRLAGIESLMSVTDPKYVRSLASRSYLEQQRLTAQTRDGREALKLMDDLGERFLKVSNPREMPTADKKMLLTGFDKVVDYIAAQRQSGMDTDYLALGMAGSFKSIKIMRDSIGAFPLTPEREQIARNFADQCDRMAGKYAGMSPDIAPKPAAPVKTIEAPKVKPGN